MGPGLEELLRVKFTLPFPSIANGPRSLEDPTTLHNWNSLDHRRVVTLTRSAVAGIRNFTNKRTIHLQWSQGFFFFFIIIIGNSGPLRRGGLGDRGGKPEVLQTHTDSEAAPHVPEEFAWTVKRRRGEVQGKSPSVPHLKLSLSYRLRTE